jgi:hypothetical protein
MSQPAQNVQRQPGCLHLLTKGMFVTGEVLPNPDVEEGESSGHCWCNLTQQSIGPDDQLVARSACVPGRSCFVARF